jgi:hypothetical protein
MNPMTKPATPPPDDSLRAPMEPPRGPAKVTATARELAHAHEAHYDDCPGPLPTNTGHAFACNRLTAAIEGRDTAHMAELEALQVELETVLNRIEGAVEMSRKGFSNREYLRDTLIDSAARRALSTPPTKEPR